MNDKQNRHKALFNILLMTLLFAFTVGVAMPLIMAILSSETPLSKFIKNEIRTIIFGTIIIFILLSIFVVFAFVKYKLEPTKDKKELKNKK